VTIKGDFVQTEKEKKEYKVPELIVSGTIAELTRSIAGAPEDVQVSGQLGSSSQG
jgi:hypothetical protein